MRHVSEPATQQLLLEHGDIDAARNLPTSNLLNLNKQLLVQTALKSNLICLCLNQQNKYLQQAEVRQAIKYLIDYQAIKDNLFNQSVTVQQSFIPSHFFAANQLNPFKLNITKAKKLLAKVGLAQGFTISLDAKHTLLAQAIQASLAAANIKVAIIPGDSKQVLTKFRDRNYEAILTTWGADYQDPHANAQSFVNNDNNAASNVDKTLAWRTNWQIPELTKLTMQAAQEVALIKRRQLYTTLQQQFFTQAPIIVLFQETDILALNNKALAYKTAFIADANAFQYVSFKP